MKSIFFLALCFSCVNFAVDPVLFNAPDLGKTHFIVGLPPVVQQPTQKTVCVAHDIESLLTCADGGFKQAFFSPDDNLESLLIKLIDAELSSLHIAIFSFTNGEIANALVRAHRRGVSIEVITDISCTKDKFNKIDLLKKIGITVFVYNPRNTSILNNIMHNKFVIFGKNVAGKSLLWTGSFNFTKSARINNQENVIIIDDAPIITKYKNQFERLKQRLHGTYKSVKVTHTSKRKRAHVVV